jgi:sialic acid synthase
MNIQQATIIAEIGCVHAGDINRAKRLISLAKICGANFVKFQKRNPYESVPKNLWNKPHPNEKFSYGKTYLEHRLKLEFDLDQHKKLKDYCESILIGYSTSVWDITSAKTIISLNPEFIKIPSACNTDFNLIYFLLNSYKGKIHISLGMTTKQEREEIDKFLIPHKERVVAYQCTSKYPCPFEDLHLLEIEKLKKDYLEVGFSNHGYGIASDIAAYMLGATFIERHFVDDRTFRHTDAAASLEPDGLRRLCRDISNVNKALTNRPEELDKEELEQKNKLKIK